RLGDLDQRPVRLRGSQERFLPMRALGIDVHQLVPAALQLSNRLPDVVGLEGDVVQTLPVAVEEARQEALSKRLQQLDLPAGKAQLNPAPASIRVAPHQILAPKGVAVERQRRLD